MVGFTMLYRNLSIRCMCTSHNATWLESFQSDGVSTALGENTIQAVPLASLTEPSVRSVSDFADSLDPS